MGQQWPAVGLGAVTVAVYPWDLLKETFIIFITSTIVWPQVNSREGTQLQPSIENCIKDLLSMALPQRTRPSFPLSQSLPLGSFLKSLILLIRGRQNENHDHRKLTKLITGSTALSNSMPYRTTQDGQVMVESSDKTWSTREENANHFSILALRTL